MTSNFWIKQYSRIARITGQRYNCAYYETIRLTRRIKKIKPDIVHIHCMNCSYINPFILLKWLGRQNIKVLVTHHADVTITANCDHAYDCDLWKCGCKKHCHRLKKEQHYIFYANASFSWKQMRNAFAKIKYLYASGVSEWMVERVKQSPFFANRECCLIENGVDIEIFKYDKSRSNKLITLFKKQGNRIILHVTPSILQPLKGGTYVLELARRMQNVIFIIVGYHNEYIENMPSNVFLIPYVSSKVELAGYYQLSDITLLTSKRESFSLVTAESLCCGTPVVGFKAGAPEAIALPSYSSFVEFGDIQALQITIEKFLNRTFDKEEISKVACKRFDVSAMCQNYLSYYEDILKD